MSDNHFKISKGVDLTPQTSAPSNPSNGAIYYDSTLSKFRKYENGFWSDLGGGGSGGSKNYLGTVNGVNGNGDFELGATTKWSLFNTTLTSLTPTGGITAGAASVTTFDTVSTAQLAGTYSLRTASSGAWAAGAGFISDAFTIEKEDRARVMTFKINYEAFANSSNVNFSGTSSNTFAIYIYDVTNSKWVQPAGVYGLTQGAGVGLATGTVQLDSTCTSARIAVLAANASAGACTMYWDDMSFGPQTASIGSVVTEPIAYTPVFTGFGTVSNVNVRSWRNGKYLFVEGYFTTGTATAVEAQMQLGFNGISGNVVSDSALPTISLVGKMNRDSGSSAVFFSSETVLVEPNKNYFTFGSESSTTNGLTKATGSAGFGSTTNHSFFAKVAIAGWSSNVQVSSDTDTRVVSAEIGLLTNYAVGAGAPIILNSVIKDTHGGYNTSTGGYTVQVSGFYDVFWVGLLSSSVSSVQLRVNGVGRTYLCQNNSSGITSAAVQISCIAGDIIAPYADQAATYLGSAAPFLTYLTISRRSGPAVIAATESVNALYETTSATSLPYNATTQITSLTTRVYDTHNAMSAGAFTVPISGKYEVAMMLTSAAITQVSPAVFILYLYKNGVLNRQICRAHGTAAVSDLLSANGVAPVSCISGDILTFYFYQSAIVAGTTLDGTATSNWVAIKRIGN